MNSRNTDALIKRAIAQALEADGGPLDWTMPRWDRKKIIPLREKAMEYAERWVNAVQLNKLYLLEVQKGCLESRREYLQALMKRQKAMVDLEVHMGGKIP